MKHHKEKRWEENEQRQLIRAQLIKELGACENCGYNQFQKILELAHIRHGLDKLQRTNLLLLCPTCHKAFDRGFISINGEHSDSQFAINGNFIELKQANIKRNKTKRMAKRNKWINQNGTFVWSQKK